MKKVINLYDETEYHYADRVSDLRCVCTSYCINNNLSRWWFALIDNDMDTTNAISSLPIVDGDKTLACGDYTILKS
jgi:hypothetical protein